MFSGDKWIHCHGSLGIVGPDGIFYDWFDEPLGRRADSHFMRESNVNNIVANAQLDINGQQLPQQYSVYLDKGFFNQSHCIAAHHGRHLSEENRLHNTLMASLRVSIEWSFSSLKSRNPLLDRWKQLKVQLFDVSKLVRVAVLLTNAYTCLMGSEAATFFRCDVPNLDSYFGVYE